MSATIGFSYPEFTEPRNNNELAHSLLNYELHRNFKGYTRENIDKFFQENTCVYDLVYLRNENHICRTEEMAFVVEKLDQSTELVEKAKQFLKLIYDENKVYATMFYYGFIDC
jgi:hypothetical protein